jgi:intergrase/recombinase
MDQTGKNTFLLDIKSQFGGIDAEKIKSKGSFANFVKKYVELVIQRDKEAEELVKILGNIKENNKDYIKVIIQKCIEIEDAAMYEVKFEEFRNEFIEFVTQKCIEGGFEELVKYDNNFHNEYIEFVTQKYKESDEFAEFLYPFAFNLEEILEFKNFLEKHEIYI